MKRSKRYQEAVKQIDKNKIYQLTEAIELIKKTATTKFDSSVEVHVHLGIDTKKADQQIRLAVKLPHPTGQKQRIVVFCNEANQKKALAAGADQVGGEELIKEIKQTQKTNFDIALATPDMMRLLGQIAKILGTKGLMPNPKNETITTDVVKTLTDLRSGKIAFRSDEHGNIHQIIGKVSFDSKKLLENYQALIEIIRRSKPEGSKGVFIKGITLTTTMGPGIRIS